MMTRVIGQSYDDVPCGDCCEPMTLRKGANGLYYSCSRFPQCRLTHNALTDGSPDGRSMSSEAKKAQKIEWTDATWTPIRAVVREDAVREFPKG